MNTDPRKPPSARLHTLLEDPAHAGLLQQRAQLLAQRLEAAEPQRLEQYVCFRLGRDEEYGLPHGVVEEVLMVDSIARVPGTPAVWSGVINRRGQMLPVLDLAQLFGIDAGEGRQRRAGVGVVVTSAAGVTVGLQIDEPIDIDSYPADVLSPAPSVHGMQADYLAGLLYGRITLLDIERILSDLCSEERHA